MQHQERLRQSVDDAQTRLRASVPVDREASILALIAAIDRHALAFDPEPMPDLITGRRLANLGGNLALKLCLEATDGDITQESGKWADGFLETCEQLAEAELVLGHVETGFVRLVEGDDGAFDAWIATKRAPVSWQERADIDWWASSLASRHRSDAQAAGSDDAHYRRLASTCLAMMEYQLGYPTDAAIDGCTVTTYRDVLSWLIGYALRERDRGVALAARSEQTLVTTIASALRADPVVISRAVAAYTLDEENAAYHAAVPGVASAPLVRVDADRLVWSIHGLTSEPLLFLTRELRRRAAEAYHNSAYLREDVFRQDLYALFPDKRFVTSTSRIELRRDSGNIRTDIDAVVFDRKTGTLGFFELKSQDPFARSTAELTRQRENLLYANRQVSGVLAWLQRYGADELLKRVDSRTAKSFRAYKVFPFVLGRYLAHFLDGAEPDRRAAWGTWPQVLRLLDGQPFRATDANPLASLFNRLTKAAPLVRTPSDDPPHAIAIGDLRLTVHPSFSAYQARHPTR
jgi:hypothetical protein